MFRRLARPDEIFHDRRHCTCCNSRRAFLKGVAAASIVAVTAPSAFAARDQSAQQIRDRQPGLIRDAEIEGLMRIYSRPLFAAAGINSGAAQVTMIGDPSINAFVAGGQRIFMNTGLITRAPVPNTVIGVLAHETGHIAGGHLAKLNSQLSDASNQAILGGIFGVATMIAAGLAGNNEVARAGGGIIAGSQTAAQRGLMRYLQGMEATADESAVRYLEATRQSAKGMLDLFRVMSNESLASSAGGDPYAYSHPVPLDRLRTLEGRAQASSWYQKQDSSALIARHRLAQAKLIGFLEPQQTFSKFSPSDNSLPARYAKAIAYFRRGDLANAAPLLSSLTAEQPGNPYFWELSAQAYLENRRAAQALTMIERARRILPNNGLFQILHAQVLLGFENAGEAAKAVSILKEAKRNEPEDPTVFHALSRAYGLTNNIPLATLSLAEFYYATGDMKTAAEKATLAKHYLKENTPEWLRAGDIESFAGKKN